MSLESRKPESMQRSYAWARAWTHAAAAVVLTAPGWALAAGLGQGLFQFAQPIILFLGFGAVVMALLGAIFNPQLIKLGVFAAGILIIVFFLLRNAAGLQAAVQAG